MSEIGPVPLTFNNISSFFQDKMKEIGAGFLFFLVNLSSFLKKKKKPRPLGDIISLPS